MMPRILLLILLLLAAPLRAEEIRIAAAADLRFAMDEIVGVFKKRHPTDSIEVAYGSSGKFHAQIQNGAPFDLFFSADIALPRKLAQDSLALAEVRPYGIGRIVLWSKRNDTSALTLADLAKPNIKRIAIANPKHAPYGMRAVEALKAAQVWGAVEQKLVYGENIAQTAQFVQTGNADVGIIALSLAMTKEFSESGQYSLIPATLHQPLEQGFVVLKRAEGKALAQAFADFFAEPTVLSILNCYGFSLPGSPPKK